MRRTLLLLSTCLGLSLHSRAQYHLPEEADWFNYDLTHEILLNPVSDLSQEWRSNASHLSVMRDFLLGTSHFSVGIGLGLSTHNYHTNLRFSVQPDGTDVFALLADTVSYSRNKITAQYLEIPVELRFRSNVNGRGRFFRFSLGFKGGLRLKAYSRFRDEKIHVVYYGLNEVTKWRYGVYTRIGFGYMSLYAFYQLNPVFDTGVLENGEALDRMNSLSVGLSLSL